MVRAANARRGVPSNIASSFIAQGELQAIVAAFLRSSPYYEIEAAFMRTLNQLLSNSLFFVFKL